MAGALLAVREAVMALLCPMLREPGVTEQQWRILDSADPLLGAQPERG